MSWLLFLLGLLLVVAPWLLGYDGNSSALWSSVILGAVMGLVAGYKVTFRDVGRWEYWVVGIAGFLALLAPFVLGFMVVPAALWTTLVIGLLALGLAAFELFVREPVRSRE